MKLAGIISAWVLGLAIVAASTLGIVVGCQNHQRGIYAGFTFKDGQRAARNALIVKYGKNFVSRMTYADPPVHNIHGHSILTGSGQVREFHVIGPRGVKYCVQVWHPGYNWSQPAGPNEGLGVDVHASYAIHKGCKF